MAANNSSKFETWIFDSYSTSFEGLGLFRIFSALSILFYCLPSTELYYFLGNLPADFYSPPPGPLMLFNGFPSEQFLLGVHFVLIISLILLLFGLATKYTSLTAGICLLIIKGFIYSLGKINHDLLIIVVPFVMAFSGWGKAYSLDAVRKSAVKMTSQNWTITFLALIIGFMFFTAGFPKILGGWLDVGTQATQGHFFKQFFVRGRQDLLAPLALQFPDLLWELLDYTTILFEAGFLVAIFHPRSTRIFICIAVLFHFSTMMIMNIAFLPNFLAYAAFLNWSRVNEKIKEYAEAFLPDRKYLNYIPPLCIIALMGISLGVIQLLESLMILQSDLQMESLFWVSCSIPLALYYLGRQVKIKIK